MAEDERQYDIVLLGATGFTGALTAAELAARAPLGARWAVAGRTRAKVEAVRDRVVAQHPDAPVPDVLVADVGDRSSLDAVARMTRVLTSTVGPYALHGEPVVAACAAAGTHYLDLTGEPEFVDTMRLRQHDAAVASGARLIHCCGFDSIPHDLGVQFTVQQLPRDVPLRVRGYVRAGARFSGGTFASALGAFARTRQTFAAQRARRRLEGKPANVTIEEPGTPHRALGAWALPLPTVDPAIVGRSARADAALYGPDFKYGHYALANHLPVAVGGAAGMLGLMAVAQVGPARRALLSRLPSGQGPSDERMERSWFSVTFVGETADGSERVVTEVRGGDPGYRETSRMLAEATLSTAFDEDLPDCAGQVTTAQALGPALRARLVRSGISFEVV
jgi:short subunit dehydrogenase-like uncharacterized protein